MPATTRAGGAVTVRPGVKIGPVGRRLAAILGHYPRKGAIYITSAFRPEERGSHHGGLSYGEARPRRSTSAAAASTRQSGWGSQSADRCIILTLLSFFE